MAFASVALHRQAAAEATEAYTLEYGSAPDLCVRQYLQAVALLESTYGYGWQWNTSGDARNSNNMGAIQAGRPPCDPNTSFETSDTRADGTRYTWCYKKYPTRIAGWRDLVRVLYKQRPSVHDRAEACDVDGAVAAQRATRYFEAPLDRYTKGINARIAEIAAALGEPLPKKGESDHGS